jgi:hypothetical protein
LVREILEQTALPRLRLSSIEPMDWDAELIGLMAEFGGSGLARHAHLPLAVRLRRRAAANAPALSAVALRGKGEGADSRLPGRN